jgi:hypothetical protein
MQIAVLVALSYILCLAAAVSAINAVKSEELHDERKMG